MHTALRPGALILTAALAISTPLTSQGATPNPEAETWDAATSVNSVAGYEAYLEAYPKGRYAAAAKIRLAGLKQGGATTTPTAAKSNAAVAPESLPPSAARIPVEASSWTALTASDHYRNAPPVKPVSVEWESESKVGENVPAVAYKIELRIEPEGDHCARITRTTNWSAGGNMSSKMTTDSTCALIGLGSVANGTPQSAINGLTLNGSLFPLRQGAEYRAERTLRHIANDEYSMFFNSQCRVVGQRPASELLSGLPGTAWVMSCQTMSAMRGQQGKPYPASEDYFIEALGLPLSSIGQLESLGGRYIVPAAGTEIKIGALKTTYSRYNVRF